MFDWVVDNFDSKNLLACPSAHRNLRRCRGIRPYFHVAHCSEETKECKVMAVVLVLKAANFLVPVTFPTIQVAYRQEIVE